MRKFLAFLMGCFMFLPIAYAQAPARQITFTETTVTPGGVVHTPFGDKTADPTTETVQKTISIDAANLALLSGSCSGATTSHLTSVQLAAQYTPAELTAALTSALSK